MEVSTAPERKELAKPGVRSGLARVQVFTLRSLVPREESCPSALDRLIIAMFISLNKIPLLLQL